MHRTWPLAALLFLAVPAARGGGWLRSQKGQPLFWRDGKVSFYLSETVHLPDGESGVDRREAASSVHAAVWNAARAWVRASQGALSIDLSLATPQAAGGTGNWISFTDPAPFDSGICDRAVYVACTVVSFNQETGEILAATIAFNPYKRHSSIGLAGAHDIGLTALHELGHALGLDHSPVLDSVMNARIEWESPASPLLQFPVRELAPDDIQTLAMQYPAAPNGRIEGTVRRGDARVAGAHVLALNPAGQPILGVLTAEDGTYSLLLPPGDYNLLAEPLDGPSLPGELASAAPSSGPFPTVYWNSAGGGAAPGGVVTLREGENRTVDFDVPESSVINASSIGLVSNGSYWGASRIHVARGRSYVLALTRTPPEGEPSFLLPPTVNADGPPAVAAATPQLVRQRIQLPPDAPLGAFTVHYASRDALAALPGALRIVPNPVIRKVIMAGAGLASVLGSDLAAQVEQGERWSSAFPLPAQLGGVSVRVGGRFVPLVAVSPGEIVFEWPEDLPAGLEVTVLTGAGVESNPVRP